MTGRHSDTIFALSSGSPPAAIAIVRISGPAAGEAAERLAGSLPPARTASLRTIRHPVTGEELDRGILLWFPGPATSTGEDLAELHLHGGRSVVAAVSETIAELESLRAAEPGEFTRRAFENGRIDLAEAEGLSDLLQAETQSQRRAALALAGGALSRKVAEWERQLLVLSAQVEAVLDFSDEGDVAEELRAEWHEGLTSLLREVEALLAQPAAERLRDGLRVVIAGPPNAGKSSLLNYLVGREAAITSPLPGTTRDVIEAPVAIRGVPFLLSDTAGLRESDDAVEAVGVDRARLSIEAADLILWLGSPSEAPFQAIIVETRADLGRITTMGVDHHVSTLTGAGVQELVGAMVSRARHLLPVEGEVALNERHRSALSDCVQHLRHALSDGDLLLIAEDLRLGRRALDSVTGRSDVENMLDALFGGLCIGK